MAEKLTKAHIEELRAIAQITGVLGKPSFVHKLNWHGLYDTLVRRRLVTWGPHPDFDHRWFRSVELTPAGRAALASQERDT